MTDDIENHVFREERDRAIAGFYELSARIKEWERKALQYKAEVEEWRANSASLEEQRREALQAMGVREDEPLVPAVQKLVRKYNQMYQDRLDEAVWAPTKVL